MKDQLKHLSEEEINSIEIAEESREVEWKSKSFLASIFSGDFDLSLIYPYPEQDDTDKAIGDDFCAKVEDFCKEHINGDEIDLNGKIPAHVFKGLADLGLFGIKISKEYGGLGMSQSNYCRILGVIARYCGSVATTLSAHQSIGVPQPLKLFGTKAQKEKYLPLIAKGAVTAFALTEPSVGSDPANMKTYVKRSEDNKSWILNGEKLWCTNGVIADYFVVMARSPDKFINGDAKKQISAFIVEAKSPGITIKARSEFLGLKAIENGVISFDNVIVPDENIIAGEGRGLKIALSTLNDGRLGIPAVVSHSLGDLRDNLYSWAKTRKQWGKQIGYHEQGSSKLAEIDAGSYACRALSEYGCALSDKSTADIRMEAAAAKLYVSELGYYLLDTALQLRGGRGYETESSLKRRGEAALPIERALRDARINRIVEGTTDIMYLFLSREALDFHLRRVFPLLDSKVSFTEKIKVFFKCAGFYPVWYLKNLLPSFKPYFAFGLKNGSRLRWIRNQSKSLSLKMFHKILLNGPKLETKQKTLARIIDIGVDLAVLGLMISRANSDKAADRDQGIIDYWFKRTKLRVEDKMKSLSENADSEASALSKNGLKNASDLESSGVIADDAEPPREFGSDLCSGKQKKRR